MAGTRRLVSLAMCLLGVLGVVVCGAGIFGAWRVSARFSGTAEKVFAQIDRSFSAVRDGVANAEQRVQTAKIASEDIEQSLKSWTKKEVGERLASRLDIEQKAQRLASGLLQADHWLEFSESSVQLVRQVLELANSTGILVKTEPADQLLGELASLRVRLTETTESVKAIRARAAEEKSVAANIDRAARLALRAIATLGSIDSRLRDFRSRLQAARTEAQDLKARMLHWILAVTIGATALAVWMAVGQIALCLIGWQRLRESRAAEAPDR